jgi:hypothetical protein
MGKKERKKGKRLTLKQAFPRIFKDRLRPHRTPQEAGCSSNLYTLSPGNPIPGYSFFFFFFKIISFFSFFFFFKKKKKKKNFNK